MAWHDENWQYRKAITLDGENIPADMADTPVFIPFNDSDMAAKALASGDDIVITDSDETTKLSHDLALRSMLDGSCIWTWFGSPRACYASNVTYVGMSRKNNTDDMDAAIGYYNHSTGAWAFTVLNAALDDDDHMSPSVLVMGNGKILVVYASHNDDRLRARISTNANDASAFDSEFNLASGDVVYNYPTPLVTSGGKIYCFYNRVETGDANDNRSVVYKTSTDNGATWSSEIELVDNSAERPYYHAWIDGDDVIHIIFSDGHPNEVGSNSIYYFSLDTADSDALAEADGTAIAASLPIGPGDAEQIYDSSASGHQSWTIDVCDDGSGNPVALFMEHRSILDHRIRLARWNGSSWNTSEVAQLGHSLSAVEPFYTPGGCISRRDPDDVYVSQSTGGYRQLVRYTTDDAGATWDAGTTVSDTGYQNIRPMAVTNAHEDMEIVYLVGGYEYFAPEERFETGLACHPRICKSMDGWIAVNVPVLTDSTDKTLYVYYGNSGASDQRDAANVPHDSGQYLAFGSIGYAGGVLVNMASWTGFEADVVFSVQEVSGDATVLSNWVGTGNANVLMRLDGAATGDALEGFLIHSSGTKTDVFADLQPTLAHGGYNTASLFWGGSTVGAALNGTTSSLTVAASGGTLDTTDSTNGVGQGFSPHALNDSAEAFVRLAYIADEDLGADWRSLLHDMMTVPGWASFGDEQEDEPEPDDDPGAGAATGTGTSAAMRLYLSSLVVLQNRRRRRQRELEESVRA